MLTKADRTRQHIIEKAAPIFNKKGYAATSMADILKAAKLAKGGVYGHFAGKDEIAAAAFDHLYGKLRDALVFKIKQGKTAEAKLLAILQFYHNYTIAGPFEGGCPLQNTAIDADDTLPFLKQRAARALKEMLGSLEYIIQRGIDEGEFTRTLNAKAEAELFFATIEGGVMMSKLTDNPGLLNNLLRNLRQQVETRYKG